MASAAHPLPTAISRAARAPAAAPTWSARRWPLPLPRAGHFVDVREAASEDRSWKSSSSSTGLVAPLDRANVDTDAIIPKQFLKSIRRSGFGPNACSTSGATWMSANPGRIAASGRRTPISCSTSRATRARPGAAGARATSAAARRASMRRGRCRTTAFAPSSAESFADIFYNNCFKNGLLPVVLSKAEMDALFGLTEHTPGLPPDGRPSRPEGGVAPRRPRHSLRSRRLPQGVHAEWLG
jgi:hypothetical protein